MTIVPLPTHWYNWQLLSLIGVLFLEFFQDTPYKYLDGILSLLPQLVRDSVHLEARRRLG